MQEPVNIPVNGSAPAPHKCVRSALLGTQWRGIFMNEHAWGISIVNDVR